jgi:ubiquinone/menaquinone biosynthesis C-methylase UbiE
MSTAPQGSTYVLGHADAEVQRLLLQGRLYDDYTEHALRLAGLRPGMRVLDIGCGPGDVSFVAARLVGPTGTVLGVDAAPTMVELARARAREKGLSTVHFTLDAVDTIVPDEPVDAVIGRLILMHLPHPAATLRRLSSFVRPGGVVAFSENDITATRSIPNIPLFGQVAAAIVRAFEAMGSALRSAIPCIASSPTRAWAPHASPRARRSVPPPTPTCWPMPRKSGDWCPPSPNNTVSP